VIEGDLDPVITSLKVAERTEKLQSGAMI
jgi:hypothetical protein